VQLIQVLISFESSPIVIAMFYIIGLGLADEKDITIKGLEVILNLILLI